MDPQTLNFVIQMCRAVVAVEQAAASQITHLQRQIDDLTRPAEPPAQPPEAASK